MSTVPYRYHHRFAVYRLAKYRTVRAVLLFFKSYYNKLYFTDRLLSSKDVEKRNIVGSTNSSRVRVRVRVRVGESG